MSIFRSDAPSPPHLPSSRPVSSAVESQLTTYRRFLFLSSDHGVAEQYATAIVGSSSKEWTTTMEEGGELAWSIEMGEAA